MDNFDLNLLRGFDALWREGQVTRAAQSLGLSQSAMSSALKRLREHLGDPLFIKTRRGMQPTPYAEQIAAEVAAVLDQVRHRVLAPPRFDPGATGRRVVCSARSPTSPRTFSASPRSWRAPT